MVSDKLKLNSFNCRGVRDRKKRLNISNWLKNNYFGITALQETHSTVEDEKIWQKEWGAKYGFHMVVLIVQV